MSSSERSGAGPLAGHSAALLRLHRHSFVHVLVLGGHAAERRDVAEGFHRESPVRLGSFLALDCGRDAEVIGWSLRCWLSALDYDPGQNPLRSAARGTLMFDRIERLTPQCQRLFLEFIHAAGAGRLPGWAGRITAGAQYDLLTAVAEGRFSRSLFDSLDKVRIELLDHSEMRVS